MIRDYRRDTVLGNEEIMMYNLLFLVSENPMEPLGGRRTEINLENLYVITIKEILSDRNKAWKLLERYEKRGERPPQDLLENLDKLNDILFSSAEFIVGLTMKRKIKI